MVAKESMKIAGFIVLGLAIAVAQAQPPNSKAPAQKPTARLHVGSDIERVVEALSKSLGEGKGQFETTDEFDERRDAVLEKIGAGKTFMVLEPARYDADDQKVYFDLSRVVAGRYMKSRYESGRGGNYLTIELRTKKVSERVYLGQNSFGAKARITELTYVRYGLVLRTDSTVKFQDGTKFEFPMDRVQARDAIWRLFLYIQGEIISPTIYEDIERLTPSVTDPYDVTTLYNYVPFRVDRAFVADIRSGQAVHTF